MAVGRSRAATRYDVACRTWLYGIKTARKRAVAGNRPASAPLRPTAPASRLLQHRQLPERLTCMLKIALTALGLLLSVIGICLAGGAYVSTNREHGSGPVWPVLNRLLTGARHLVRRALRRNRDVTIHATGAAGATVAVLQGEGVVSRGPAPPDLSVEEQLRWIERRIELVEMEAIRERSRRSSDVHALRTAIGDTERQIREVENASRELAKSVAVGTIRLQITSLLFVGAGTVALAIPGFMP